MAPASPSPTSTLRLPPRCGNASRSGVIDAPMYTAPSASTRDAPRSPRSFPMNPTFKNLTPPKNGAAITLEGGKLNVPNNPIIPFIEGDGTGPDIWRASQAVFDAAVEKAYGGKRKVEWMEVLA